jgi:hypothetical protein
MLLARPAQDLRFVLCPGFAQCLVRRGAPPQTYCSRLIVVGSTLWLRAMSACVSPSRCRASCRWWADKAPTRDLRQLFLELAADWSELAGLRRRLEADRVAALPKDRSYTPRSLGRVSPGFIFGGKLNPRGRWTGKRPASQRRKSNPRLGGRGSGVGS